jgi:anti-anti-sigma factor
MVLQEQAAEDEFLRPTPASIEVRMLASDTMLVQLSGEHDATTHSRLADAFVAVRHQANVIVDLTPCSSIDSSILTMLLRAHDALMRDQRRLAVALPTKVDLTRKAELERLSDLLPAYASVEAALTSFR